MIVFLKKIIHHANLRRTYNFSLLSPNRIGLEKVIDARPNKPGIYCYGIILGIILKLFGYAIRVDGPTRTYYVNNNSLKYWKERQKTAYHLSPTLDNLDEIIDRMRNAPIIPAIPVQAPPAKKRNEIPQIIPNSYERPIPIKQPVKTLPHSPNRDPDPLRIKFEQTMQQTMGNHLSDVQKQTLMQFFDQAIQTTDPQNTLNQLIDSKINQPNGWGSDKANNHISWVINIRTNFLRIGRKGRAMQ